jgi:tRNA(adenine34) deaminase
MSDAQFLQMALNEARRAGQEGEVPVGAVLVKDGQVIATGRNANIALQDPSAHAEMQALRAAAHGVGNHRLDGCTLYVTLEPCTMCAGAMLHARLARVVYAAPDPKTGAAGGALNVFANAQINHQTQVQSATELGADCEYLAGASSQLLQEFFKPKRTNASPVREDALRTPEERFTYLPDYPWPPNYLSDLPALNGLRMHYLDVGPRDAPSTYLCLHGNPAWSYLYRKMIPIFSAAGHRVVAPDLIGFGKSDKPKKDSAHNFSWHRQVLLEFVERLNLQNVVLVVQDWGGLLGLTLPMQAPERYKALLVMNTALATGNVPLSPGFLAWREMCAKNPEFDVARLFARSSAHLSPEECAAYNAPFPDKGHRAALRAFPPMVPEFEGSDGAAISREAKAFWQERWSGQSLMAIGAQDPVLGPAVMRGLQKLIRHCPEPLVLEQAGHFVQEWGEDVARAAVRAFETSS